VLAPAQYPEPEIAPTVNSNLTERQQFGLGTLLSRFPDIWASKGITGRTNLVRHRVPTRDAAPVKAKPRRMSQTDMQIIRENVIGMQASGVVMKSNSEWISEPVLVVRKYGDIRFCVDYRPLNEVTVKDQ